MCVYENRRALLQRGMQREEIAAVVVPPSSDFLYLTGSPRPEAQRPAALVMTQERAVLLMPAFECGSEPALAASLELCPYSDEQDAASLLAGLLPARGCVAVGRQMRASLLLSLQAHRAALRWQSADSLLVPLRSRKSAEEICILETAQHMAERALTRLLEEPLIGRTEKEIAARLRQLRLDEGFDAVGNGIVASGPNTALPHHVNGDRAVCRGDALMFDIGGTYRGYRADFTRTFAVGRLPDGFEDVYSVVLQAHLAGRDAAAAGVPASDVDQAARRVISQAGYGPFFTHRLGHGIGLDIHEAPFIAAANTAPLETGNVFSCEPGIYLPGRFGIRIEDLLVLQDDGVHSLNTLSKQLQIV